MIDFFDIDLKRRIRPLVLPLWLNLWKSSHWQNLINSTRHVKRRRRFLSFGVGLPKTGTKSLAKMLQQEYRAAHEPETWIVTDALTRSSISHGGPETAKDQTELFRARDSFLSLEFESNWVLGLAIKPLYKTFPDAKYILTVRDCMSWVNSEINQHYVIGHRQPWRILSDYRYGQMRVYSDMEKGLEHHGLYPTQSYFRYWADHIRLVLDTVPSNNLLVLRTRDLSHKIKSIASFLGIPEDSLDLSRSHSHRRKDKPLNIYDLVEADYLHQQAEFYCKATMKELFGVKTADAKASYLA